MGRASGATVPEVSIQTQLQQPVTVMNSLQMTGTPYLQDTPEGEQR